MPIEILERETAKRWTHNWRQYHAHAEEPHRHAFGPRGPNRKCHRHRQWLNDARSGPLEDATGRKQSGIRGETAHRRAEEEKQQCANKGGALSEILDHPGRKQHAAGHGTKVTGG